VAPEQSPSLRELLHVRSPPLGRYCVCKRLGQDQRRTNRRNDHVQQAIIAALVVASAAVALTTKVNAGPRAQTAPTSHDAYYIERASQNHDNGGN
jgi:hypothetical protein